MNAEAFAARVRGILVLSRLIQRLQAIKFEEKTDEANLKLQATDKFETLLKDLRHKEDTDVVATYLNADLDACESVVKMLEDAAGFELMVKERLA